MAGLFRGGIEVEVVTGGTSRLADINVSLLYVDQNHRLNVKRHDGSVNPLALAGDISAIGMTTFDGRYINVTGGNLLGQLVLTDTASIVPVTDGVVSIGTSSNRLSHLHSNEVHVGSNSLYVNGKKVLSDSSGTITVSTDPNQSLDLKTTGTGILRVVSDQEILVLTNGTAKDINLQASGNVNFTGNAFGVTLVNPNAATVNTNTIETRNNKGAANGYAELDSNSKLPIYRIPDSLIGNVEYQGGWAASVNTPTIVAPTSANKGWYYVTTTPVASGHGYPNVPNTDFQVGDWIISNGSLWQKVDNTDAVVSVFGRIGSVVGISGDYTANQIMVTPVGNVTSINVQSALQELDNIKASSSIVTNQATQIATISANQSNYSLTSTVGAISAGLDSRITTINALDANQATQISAISASLVNYALTSLVANASANALVQADNYSDARDNNQDTLITSISANYALSSFVVSASANALSQANNTSSARDNNQDTLIASISGQVVSNTALDVNQATQIAAISASLGNYAFTTLVANASANALAQADNYSDARDSNQDTLIASISANYALSSFVVSASANALNQANNTSSARDTNQDTLIASISGQVLSTQALDANQATQISSISAALGSYALTSLVSSSSANSLAQANNYSDARNANQDTLIASISANYALSSFVVSSSANALNQANNYSDARDANQDTLVTSISAQLVANTALDANQATQIAAISASQNLSLYTLLTTTAGLTGSLQSQIVVINALDANQASQIAAISASSGGVSVATVAAVSAGLYAFTVSASSNALNQANNASSARDNNQDTLIAAISANYALTTLVSSASANALLQADNYSDARDSNQDTRIAAISANYALSSFVVSASANAFNQASNAAIARDNNQNTLIAQISGTFTPLTTTSAISGQLVNKSGDTMNGLLTLNGGITSPNNGNGSEAFGALALLSGGGQCNTAVGYTALEYNFTGVNNTGVGFNALTANTSGNYNTAIGGSTLSNNTTGSSNTVVGYGAMATSALASNNTAIGYLAGNGPQAGSNNTFLGYNAGGSDNLTNSTAVGSNAGITQSNQIMLGNNAVTQVYTYGALFVNQSGATSACPAKFKGFDKTTISIDATQGGGSEWRVGDGYGVGGATDNGTFVIYDVTNARCVLTSDSNGNTTLNRDAGSLSLFGQTNFALTPTVSGTKTVYHSGNLTPATTPIVAATSASLYAIIAASSGSSSVTNHGAITFIIDGSGVAPGTGFQNYIQCPYSGTIQSWTIVGDASGTCAVDVWKGTYAQLPLTVSQSIVSTDAPSLSGTRINRNQAVSVWSVQVSAGDFFGFNLNAVSGITKISTTINILKAN